MHQDDTDGTLYSEYYAKVKIDDDDDDDDDAVSWQIIQLDLTIQRQKTTLTVVLFYKVFSYVPIGVYTACVTISQVSGPAFF